jgi:hypothetical protein
MPVAMHEDLHRYRKHNESKKKAVSSSHTRRDVHLDIHVSFRLVFDSGHEAIEPH